MNRIVALWKKESVALIGLFTAVIAGLSEFGVDISSSQQATLVGFVALVGAIVGRSQVTSVAGLAKRDADVAEYLQAAKAVEDANL
jgi:hypothetical protein